MVNSDPTIRRFTSSYLSSLKEPEEYKEESNLAFVPREKPGFRSRVKPSAESSSVISLKERNYSLSDDADALPFNTSRCKISNIVDSNTDRNAQACQRLDWSSSRESIKLDTRSNLTPSLPILCTKKIRHMLDKHYMSYGTSKAHFEKDGMINEQGQRINTVLRNVNDYDRKLHVSQNQHYVDNNTCKGLDHISAQLRQDSIEQVSPLRSTSSSANTVQLEKYEKYFNPSRSNDDLTEQKKFKKDNADVSMQYESTLKNIFDKKQKRQQRLLDRVARLQCRQQKYVISNNENDHVEEVNVRGEGNHMDIKNQLREGNSESSLGICTMSYEIGAQLLNPISIDVTHADKFRRGVMAIERTVPDSFHDIHPLSTYDFNIDATYADKSRRSVMAIERTVPDSSDNFNTHSTFDSSESLETDVGIFLCANSVSGTMTSGLNKVSEYLMTGQLSGRGKKTRQHKDSTDDSISRETGKGMWTLVLEYLDK